jgi:hypothetical protein
LRLVQGRRRDRPDEEDLSRLSRVAIVEILLEGGMPIEEATARARATIARRARRTGLAVVREEEADV